MKAVDAIGAHRNAAGLHRLYASCCALQLLQRLRTALSTRLEDRFPPALLCRSATRSYAGWATEEDS
jgi:hypothetical protein